MNLFEQLHPDWQSALSALKPKIDSIEGLLEGRTFLPESSQIFRALQTSMEQARVVIIGQDPYPNPDFACGYAFSTPAGVTQIPKSLQNILKEVIDDVGSTQIKDGNLSPWVEQGVVLLNRVLTLDAGVSNSHIHLGWQEITGEVCRQLSSRGAVVILWGKSAGELKEVTNTARTIIGVHPSPLSAYRGFFGSKPFSKTNELLIEAGKPVIIW